MVTKAIAKMESGKDAAGSSGIAAEIGITGACSVTNFELSKCYYRAWENPFRLGVTSFICTKGKVML